MAKYQSLDSKVEDIYKLLNSGLSESQNFIKFIRIPLTEQSTLRPLSEDKLRSELFHYRSSKARCKDRTADSVEEHVVPIKVITEILLSEYEKKGSISKQFIKKVLDKLLWVVFVTEEENQRLNELGLKNDMPDDWDWKKDSPFARYEKAKIKVDWDL